MRLAEFIRANVEPILAEWEAFARSVWPAGAAVGEPAELRDHAAEILLATVDDMAASQTGDEQSAKSRGLADHAARSAGVFGASAQHAAGRVASGFDLVTLVAEYRALRASVLRLWRDSGPQPDTRDLADLTRFNESIDQSLAVAVRSYTEQVDRSRQMFLAILGHDLRGPLQSMMMSAQLLEHTNQLDPESAAVAAQISTSATAMGHMIRDLLDFTMGTLGGRIPVAPAAMDLGRLCQEVIDEVRAADPACAVHYHVRGDLAGEWDAGRLREVVSNLVGNAVQHGGDPCQVSVSVRGEDGEVVLAVHNDGPPIPASVLPTIFNPLVRADPPPGEARRRSRPGSFGLGLYIAHEVVAAHGGTIVAESSAAAGTTFTVRLPRHHAQPQT